MAASLCFFRHAGVSSKNRRSRSDCPCGLFVLLSAPGTVEIEPPYTHEGTDSIPPTSVVIRVARPALQQPVFFCDFDVDVAWSHVPLLPADLSCARCILCSSVGRSRVGFPAVRCVCGQAPLPVDRQHELLPFSIDGDEESRFRLPVGFVESLIGTGCKKA